MPKFKTELGKVFALAAKNLESRIPSTSECACLAIVRVNKKVSHRFNYFGWMELYSVFKNDAIAKGPYGVYWGANFSDINMSETAQQERDEENHNCRVLMLCFMSAIAEADPEEREKWITEYVEL